MFLKIQGTNFKNSPNAKLDTGNSGLILTTFFVKFNYENIMSIMNT